MTLPLTLTSLPAYDPSDPDNRIVEPSLDECARLSGAAPKPVRVATMDEIRRLVPPLGRKSYFFFNESGS